MNRLQRILHDRDAPIEAQRAQMLGDHGGRRGRITLQQFADGSLERIQFAGTVTMCRWRSRRLHVLRYRAAADVKLACNLAQRPLIHQVKTVNGVDLIRREHGATPFILRKRSRRQRDVVCKIAGGEARWRNCFQHPHLRRS